MFEDFLYGLGLFVVIVLGVLFVGSVIFSIFTGNDLDNTFAKIDFGGEIIEVQVNKWHMIGDEMVHIETKDRKTYDVSTRNVVIYEK